MVDDYIKDGLLHCGKCNTPKQVILTIGGRDVMIDCTCECEQARMQAERDAAEKKANIERIKENRRAGFPDREIAKHTFEADDNKNPKLTSIAKAYVQHFPEMLDAGKGILFYGGVGTGKTFLAACIANALIDKGYACLVTNFSRLINKIGGLYDGKQEYIDSLNAFDLLIIDDLAAERSTEYVREIVNNVIDARYRAGLPLIVTTNLTADELKYPDDIARERTYSRLMEMCVFVNVDGTDRRKEKLKQDHARLKGVLGL